MDFEIFDAIPYSEEPIDLNYQNSLYWQFIEAKVLIKQIIKTIGGIPSGIRFLPKANNHDFGRYVTIGMYFNPECDEHLKALNDFEDNFPENWTNESKEELKKLNHPLYIA